MPLTKSSTAKAKGFKDRLKLFSPRHKTRASSKSLEDTFTSVINELDSDSDTVSEDASCTAHSTYESHSPNVNERSDTPDDIDSRLKRIENIVLSITPTLRNEIQSLKASQKKKLNNIKDSLIQVEKDLMSTKDENAKLKADNALLHDRINSQEAYSRRNNLILHNVPEDQAPLKITVCRILSNMGITNVDTISFEAIHRIGRYTRAKPKPLLFCLSHRPDRDRIWSAKRNLKGTQFQLEEDKARRTLMPVMMAARTNKKKVMFIKDKLKVEGHIYGVNDMSKLPDYLNPEQGCIKQSRDTLCFFSRHTPLSNFYQCPIKVEDHVYNCVEQYLQKLKAETMGDEETAIKIMSEIDPTKQKVLSRTIKGDEKKWKSKASTITYKAIRAKFEQNEVLREYLLASGTKTLGEASKDNDWGIGATLHNPHILDRNSWTGQNWLGKLLMKARDELK
jgi:ribA/ribD-fused uncharacterized protein